LNKPYSYDNSSIAHPLLANFCSNDVRSEIQAELLQEQLEALKVPTLILQGGNDSNQAIAQSQTYAQKASGAQLQLIDQGGNDVAEASPELVAQCIQDFITRIER
jgi:pimeloyl-ACP methyl ester carboxylesterase